MPPLGPKTSAEMNPSRRTLVAPAAGLVSVTLGPVAAWAVRASGVRVPGDVPPAGVALLRSVRLSSNSMARHSFCWLCTEALVGLSLFFPRTPKYLMARTAKTPHTPYAQREE